MKKALGKGNRTCKRMEQKKATARGKSPMVQNEWFYCEVQGHGREKAEAEADQTETGL